MKLLAGAAVIGLAAAVLWWAWPESPEARLAARLAGEHWYAVLFRHRPIGHYRTRNGRTAGGDFEFGTTLLFRLAGNGETRIEDRLVFHRRPPHRLLHAEHVKTGGSAQRRVSLGGGAATVVQGADRRRIDWEGDLELGDYLAVERWLSSASPTAGDVRSSRAVDFDRLAVVTHRWRILERDDAGTDIARESSPDAARVRLDAERVPSRMTMGDLFVLERVADEATARLWERNPPLFSAATHRVSVDRVIPDPAALRRLVVAVEHESGRAPWPGAPASARLIADIDSRRPADAGEVAAARSATVTYPAAQPRFRALAERAVAGLGDPGEQAGALAVFVRGYLRYRDTADVRTVFDTLRDRSGDCTEFADLYTTLARALGLPARTVVGLAYQGDGVADGSAGAFVLHAWNEVAIDGAWRGVDPTWGRTGPDATHLALPAGAALAAIAELPHLRLRVVEMRY